MMSNPMNLTFFSFSPFISGQIVTVLCSMLGILYWTRRSLMPWHTLTLLEFLAEQFRAHCWRKLFTWKYKVELFSCIEKASIPSWIKLSKCCSRLVLSNKKKCQITSGRSNLAIWQNFLQDWNILVRLNFDQIVRQITARHLRFI